MNVMPLCPVCSSPPNRFERPDWRFAANTSRREGRDCYAWTGCDHAQAVGTKDILRTPEERAEVERKWIDAVPKLFAQKTERWTEAQRETFRAKLLDRPHADQLSPGLPLLAQSNNEPPNQ